MFSIGSFARHGRVSVRMLRHYDAIGLLRPAASDPTTGYRTYEAGQLARLNQIVVLKELGFSLQQVATMLDTSVSPAELRGMLRLRQAELEAQIDGDTARLAHVAARLRALETDPTTTAAVAIKPIEPVRVAQLFAIATGFEPAAITPVVRPLFAALSAQLETAHANVAGPPIAYYRDADHGDGIEVHAAFPIDGCDEGQFGFDIVELPAIERAATTLHHGSMDDVMATVQTLARWIDAHGDRSAGYNREVYLDCGPNEANWVVELQEPLHTQPPKETHR
jgi:DNA-binding transcriptional MerR regulator/predicted transcriptional regulator YdeE